jgi:arylsulfatase A-like enzyme
MGVTNVVLILADDLGFSDIGSYGGEIDTPVLDALAADGVRLSSFYNTARCSPSRASLLTGRHPHETGIGVLNSDDRPEGYAGSLSPDVPTIAERLGLHGYATCMVGKWHLSSDTSEPNSTWPTRRGFDEFFGTLGGGGSYFNPRLYRGEERIEVPADEDFYLTDALSDYAVGFIGRQPEEEPFFLYLAYTAPHWPLHAREEDIEHYRSRFDTGWDALRERRHERAADLGILPTGTALSARTPSQPAWTDAEHKEWEVRRMATYAAQVTAMDRGIGSVLAALAETGRAEDTMVIFLSDNGAAAEMLPPPNKPHFAERNPNKTRDGRPVALGNRPEVWPGPEESYGSYGPAWANVSNAPFRLYKRWVHEGGIASPFIVRWPTADLPVGALDHRPFQLTDVLPTILDAVGGPSSASDPGLSMMPALRGEPVAPTHTLYWEHIGNCAIRDGRWKLVREADGPWELYDLEVDRSETNDLAGPNADVVKQLAGSWQQWADSSGVIPWPKLKSVLQARGN